MDITTQAVAQRVTNAIEASGMSVASVAEQAAVPRVTLIRRLSGASSFRLDELDRIAKVLDLPTLAFLGDAA